MKIVTHLDMLMLKKKVRAKELAAAIGVSEQSLSIFKTGKSGGIRFSTLAAICQYLKCQPGELLSFEDESEG